MTQFPRPEDPDLALRQAIAAAREQNKPIEVTAVGTESSWTWAYPDGKLTTQSFAGQARVKQADGSFRWVDTTLVADGDRVRPKVAVAEVELGGGDSPFLASMERDGQRFALDWQDRLPQPRLDGNKAIYPDAAGPGADVVVTALAGGFRHDVVIRQRPSGPVEYRLPITTEGLDLAEAKGGGLKLTDNKGKTVASAATPYVEEAPSSDPKSGIAHRGRIDLKLARGEGGGRVLVVRPDPAFLADKNTTYPVTVDPVVSLTATTDAWVEHVNNTANSTGEVFNVGTGTYWAQERQCQGSVCTSTNKIFPQFVRGYVKFQDSSEYLGKYIDSASIQLVGYYTGPCTDAVITASAITSAWSTTGLSWNTRPPTTSTGAVTTQPSCDSGIITNSINVTEMARTWAAGTPNHGVELKSNEDPRSTWPDDPNPRVTQYWSFDSVESGQSPAMLSVTYLLPPEIPTVTGESIDSIVGNDAISRTTDVKINYSTTALDGKKLDYLVSIADPTTALGAPEPTPTPTPTPPPPGGGDTQAAAHWRLDEPSGTTALDTSGHGHDALISSLATRGPGRFGGAVTRTPAGSVAMATTPVLRTDQSYTVAGWLKLNDRAGWYQLAQQNGTTRAPFYLGVDAGSGDILYVHYSADTASPTQYGVYSGVDAPVGQWFHLAGVYDATAGRLSVYLNGSLLGTTTGVPASWNATGPTTIGTHINGSIDDVRLYQKALTATQIGRLVNLRGYWPMDEGTGTFTADAAGQGQTATLHPSATWGPGKFGRSLTKAGGIAATAAGPALRTDQSYTVAGWLKLNDRAGWYQLAQQNGTTRAPFYLGVDAGSGDILYVHYSADTASPTQYGVYSGVDAPVGQWFHLAGVYDATAGRLSVYLNGSLLGTTTGVPASWNATGPTTIGTHINGSIDDVAVFQKSLTQTEIQSLAAGPLMVNDAPPSAPGALNSVAGPEAVELSWGPATDDMGTVRYQVQRSTTAEFSQLVVLTTTTATTYVNSGMPQGLYYYRVVPIDSIGQQGPASNVVFGRTSAQLFPPISSALSGQVIRSEFQLGSPDSFKFKIKACLTGVTPRICSETPYYRITSDAPHLPSDLATGTEEPLNPTLSGIVSRPSGGPVKGRFYLYAANGTPLGPVPLAEGAVSGGERLTARVPDGLIVEDGSYYWRMDACLAEICTPMTAPVPFGAPVPEPESPPTQQVTLSGSALTIRSAPASATACAGAPCPLASSTAQVGGAGSARKVSLIKADMSSLPPGAMITSAVLDLGGATCDGSCPNSQVIAAHIKKSELEENPTGSALVADLVQLSQQQVQVGTPEIDVTANAYGWRHEVPEETFIDPGVVVLSNDTVPPVELGGSGAARPTSLRVTYRPAGPPGIIPRIDVRQGDGGALLRWARPDDLGADTEIQNFDLEVLDAGNTVVQSLTVTEATVIVGGLANGTTYRFQVRTRTPFGVGPWKVSGDAAPQAVPGGPTAYQDAVDEYAEAKQSLLDGRTENTGEAIEDATEASRIEPMLYARQQDLTTTGVEDRATDGVQLADTLVSKLDDNTVVVRSAVTGTTVYDGQDDPVENEWTTTQDFVFAADANGNGRLKLSGEKSASAVDAQAANDSSQVNAWPGGVAPNPVTELPPVDDSTADPPAFARTLAASPFNRRELASLWAVLSVGPANNKGWEYRSDCANFVSKALARGGKFRQIHSTDWWSWLDKRIGLSWWERGWGDDSFTFTAAHKNYEHFLQQRFGDPLQTRGTVSATWTPTDSRLSNVKIGDTVYFLNKDNGEYTHVGIVTNVKGGPPINIKQVYFAQHGGDRGTGSGPFMNLGERFDYDDFSGLVFGRVNW
ncbi:LamG-like jellyroll fold domain-containing protein [Acrocarpospora macrocephala]|uniref:LamG-like jellyroll fold domain-containing protein n=3 Tax=Acrocarpospora macrocephala TaxID=150177 RepID=UPI0031DC6A1F